MALLQMRGITKVFPGVIANDSINLNLEAGEIHAVVGENGAGKTTLMKILYGLYAPDEGEISVRDEAVHIHGPRDAIQKGIGMVHQHFMLIPPFSVLQNVVLGEESRERGGSLLERIRGRAQLDLDDARQRLRSLIRKNRLEVDLDASVEDLPVGLQQRVEILKVLYRGAEVLVFDEPTAVLTPQESEDLFQSFRELKDQGKGIIFISHKLDEVLAIADRITVIRRGRVVETMPREGATKAKIAELMVGKPVLLNVDNPSAEPGEVILSVENISMLRGEVPILSEVSFQVRAGEIYGIAGVEGNGQSELIRAVTDSVSLASGRVLLNGTDASDWDIRKRRDAGVAHIPEDRQRYGLFLPFAIADNLTLGRHHRPPFVGTMQFRNRKAIDAFAEQAIADYDIRTPNARTPADALSGGNQQKLIIAREMSAQPDLLVAAQPTRGVDIGAMEFIYRQIVAAKKQGKAVLLISADLDEIMALSDRIGVMFKGRIIRELDRASATKEAVGYFMMGAEEHAAEA